MREVIVEIEVLLTTTQGKRRDSSATLRQQTATTIVIKWTHTENKSNNFKSDLSCWNFRSGHCKYGDSCKFSHKNWLAKIFKLDSGADATIVKNKCLIENYIEYKKSQKWLTATNEPLMVEGEGTIKLTPYSACTKIYYSPYIEENVLATRDFQKTGFQILFPAEIGNGTGAWIINEENKIV